MSDYDTNGAPKITGWRCGTAGCGYRFDREGRDEALELRLLITKYIDEHGTCPICEKPVTGMRVEPFMWAYAEPCGCRLFQAEPDEQMMRDLRRAVDEAQP